MPEAAVPEGALLLALVTLQRLVELAISRRNTCRLLARGAVEAAPGHYPLIVAVHAAWLAALWWFGWDADVQLGWLAGYLALQVLRVWILVSLGERWTTRIVVIDEPLVARGPYRFVRHPNYLLVVGEIAVVPLALGLPWLALAFSALNAGALRIRIAAEDKALRRPDAAA